MKHTAVALLSGGLDSTLAVKLMIDQGIRDYPCPAGGCLLTDRAGRRCIHRDHRSDDRPLQP